jgi:hypothetical protein
MHNRSNAPLLLSSASTVLKSRQYLRPQLTPGYTPVSPSPIRNSVLWAGRRAPSLPLPLSLSPPVCVYVSLSLSLSLFVCVSASVCMCVPLFPLCPSLPFSLCLSHCPCKASGSFWATLRHLPGRSTSPAKWPSGGGAGVRPAWGTADSLGGLSPAATPLLQSQTDPSGDGKSASSAVRLVHVLRGSL